MKQPTKYLTTPQLQALLESQGLKLSVVTVRNWIPSVVPAYLRQRSPGGHWRVDRVASEYFLRYYDSRKSTKNTMVA